MSAVDRMVASGRFANRSEALRAALARLLLDEREREIEEAYRLGYGEHPQQAWIGEAGLAAFAAFDRAEGGDAL